MTPPKKRPVAENKAPKEVEQDIPLTKEMFSAQMQRLIERARAAGLNPIQTMAKTYVRQGMSIIEGLMASLENEDISKKSKKE